MGEERLAKFHKENAGGNMKTSTLKWVLAGMTTLGCLVMVCLSKEAQAQTTVTIVNPSSLVCPVTKPNPEPAGASTDYLVLNYDFDGSDLGISVDDPINKLTWVFGGDAIAADEVAWFGVFGPNKGGANMIGYLDGADYGNPDSLCDHFKLVTVPGMKSDSGGGVFSPDVMTAPPNDPISNYIFNPTPNVNGATVPIIPANSGIPGIDESTTGAFFYQTSGANPSETIYLFYAGSPGIGINYDGTLGIPITSVSYLAAWDNPSPVGTTNNVAPTNYQIISRVDYNLENNTTTCPGKFPAICPPAAPAGWQSTAPTSPLGGHFVWVATEAGDDGYVYMFGTGKFRASDVYLARMPLTSLDLIGHCSSPPCYLGQTPGFQIWTASGPNASQQTPWWSSSPPSTAEINNAAPLSFPDDTTADSGQISVRFFDTLGSSGLWLMMSGPVGNPAFSQKVIARWALSPTGPWSNALVVFDLSNATGSQNQKLYCCQGQWNHQLDSLGLKVWECLGPRNGAPAQQIIECKDASTTQTSGSAGLPRYGFYAPFMLPYLTNVSSSTSIQSGIKYVMDTFTVSYLLSIFDPYNSVLMEYTLQVVAPVVINMSITPGSLNFGNVYVGQSRNQTITITNQSSSTAALTGSVGTLSAPFSIVSGGGAFELSPGQSVTVTVQFSPTTAGPAPATLSITHNATNQTNPTNISLTGTGVSANAPVISVTPTSGIYGNVKVKKSITASFVVKNAGKTNLLITSSSITGTDTSMFKITSGGGSKTIKPGKSLTIKVTFKPTSTGSKSANLEITSNDPVTPTLDIPLSGTGQ